MLSSFKRDDKQTHTHTNTHTVAPTADYNYTNTTHKLNKSNKYIKQFSGNICKAF